MEGKMKVAYINSPSYVECCEKLSRITNRARMTDGLIHAYQLDRHCQVVTPKPATDTDLLSFHSEDYVEHLKSLNDADDEELVESDFGLGYDCPLIDGVYDYCAMMAGASLTAAQCLISGGYQVAINWGGGWHHARKDEAAGFCYVNDIVLAILKLREKFSRVLYIDLDLHHGDGVEEAFAWTSKVMTVSLHKLAPGFYPGTGNVADVGFGKSKFYSVNVPLKDGLDDRMFSQIFRRVSQMVMSAFQPEAVVCQCGADGLCTDPMKSFNLTSAGYVHCIRELLSWNLPLMLCGGGGYDSASTAKCWTALTAAVLNQELNNDIPDHEFLMDYGPDYCLDINASHITNRNTDQEVDKILSIVEQNLQKVVIV